MNKVIKIRIDQGTLLVLIFNSCCFDHDDVIWNVQKVRVLENMKEDETQSLEKRRSCRYLQ
jgi:hypothetical protein